MFINKAMWEKIKATRAYRWITHVCKRIGDTLVVQKFCGWLIDRGSTVAVIWLLVSGGVRLTVFFFGAEASSTKTGKPSIFSAKGIADEVADIKLLGYLVAGWLLFVVASAAVQLFVKMKAGERNLLRVFSNHMADELSSASTHAAFAYLFSIVIVAESSPSEKEWLTILAFCVVAIFGFDLKDKQLEEEDRVHAKDLGLTIDRLKNGSIVKTYQDVTGSLLKPPSAGYHLWAYRDWQELYETGEFYPEMELVVQSRNKSWAVGPLDDEKTHTWKAPRFHFGGEPGHKRVFGIVMVNDTDHKKMSKSLAHATAWNALRAKAKETFKGYPTPTMSWDQIRPERCVRIIVQLENPQASAP